MLTKVKVASIRPNPFNARKSDDGESIKSLAEEIKQVGLWAGALRGREHNGHVELCFGHRRLKAIKHLGWSEVEVDVVKLSDEEMALQGMVENLQREGLNDADKGEAIQKYLELSEKKGESRRLLLDELTSILGYKNVESVNRLLQIAGFGEEAKEEIRQGRIESGPALEAYRLGGEEAVSVFAEKGIAEKVTRQIRRNLESIHDAQVREKVRAKVLKGEVTTPEEVVTKARQFAAAKQTKEWRKEKPDLIEVIRAWTERAGQWSKQLNDVVPYMEYIDQEPVVAKRWRSAVAVLIEKLQQFA